jgi:hypothetical protein
MIISRFQLIDFHIDKLYNRLLHLPKGQSEQDWEKRNAPKSKSLTNLPLKKNAEKTKENPLYAGMKTRVFINQYSIFIVSSFPWMEYS